AHVGRDVADVAFGLGLRGRHGVAEHADLTGVGCQHAHGHADRGALAGAVGPDQAHHLAGLQLERDSLQLEEAVGLADAPQAQVGGGAHDVLPARSVLRSRVWSSSSVMPSWRAISAALRRCSSSFCCWSSLAALPRPLSATNEPLPWRVTITPSDSRSR